MKNFHIPDLLNVPHESNKVTVSLGSKPIIKHIVHFFQSFDVATIVVVVGHAKESVIAALEGDNAVFVEQKEQLGTGDALAVAMDALPLTIQNVFVVYGDDGLIYNPNNKDIMEKLLETHSQEQPAITFLTIEQDNPYGLGRIVRNADDKLTGIVEEKDATEEQREIKEINPGTFIFNVEFLKKYLPLVEKSPVTGEYYLTSLIDLAFQHGEKIETVKGGKMAWRGVNTIEELEEANKLFIAME